MTKYEKNVLALIIVFFILYFYGIFVSIYDRTHTEAKLIENLEMQVNELIFKEEYSNFALEESLKETKYYEEKTKRN